jgi:hypothetical protein
MGPSHQCRLLESGESLSALWLARYPDSGKERKRVLRVPRCPAGPIVGPASLHRVEAVGTAACQFALCTLVATRAVWADRAVAAWREACVEKWVPFRLPPTVLATFAGSTSKFLPKARRRCRTNSSSVSKSARGYLGGPLESASFVLWWSPRRRELYTPPVSSQAQPARFLQCFDPLGTLRHFACSLEAFLASASRS